MITRLQKEQKHCMYSFVPVSRDSAPLIQFFQIVLEVNEHFKIRGLGHISIIDFEDKYLKTYISLIY